ncbi:MAG: transporter substrate-binding domain-containing protein [Rhizobium sp.]
MLLKTIRRVVGKIAAAALIGLGIASAAQATTVDDIVKRGTINIGVLTQSPQWSFLDENQNLAGYEIDAANLIGRYLGVKVNFVSLVPANRIPYLISGKIDAVFAIFGITPERAQQIAFSIPYSSNPTSLYAPKAAKIGSWADVANYRISVARGGVQERIADANAPKGTKILRFDSNAEETQAIVTGQADVIITVASVISEINKASPDLQVEPKLTLSIQHNGIGVAKENTDLLRWFNTTINYVKYNGELDAIHRKWFGEPLPQLPSF